MVKVFKISKYGEIEDSYMLEILKLFKKEMFKFLLFLRNLKCIKLLEIDESGDILIFGEVVVFV